MHDAAQRPASVLVLGGARSGKSTFAQRQVETSGREPVYIATAQAHDGEMVARIAAHAAARDGRWRTVDAPYDLVGALAETAAPHRAILVDCLTLWLTNVMLRGDDVAACCTALVEAVGQLQGPAVFVSNEVGGGIVPDNALARRFRDAQGRLNQDMAAVCRKVVLVVAGLPIMLDPRAAFDQLI